MQSVSVVILAGGYSRRMGIDKADLVFAGQTALVRMQRLGRLISQDVWVARRPDQPTLHGYAVVLDQFEGAGPLAGVERALATCAHEWCLVLPVDAVGVSVGFLQTLVAELERAGDARVIVVRDGERLHPLHGLYHRSLQPLIAERLAAGQRRVQDMLDQVTVHIVDDAVWGSADPAGASLWPCNTPEEALLLEDWVSRHEREASRDEA